MPGKQVRRLGEGDTISVRGEQEKFHVIESFLFCAESKVRPEGFGRIREAIEG